MSKTTTPEVPMKAQVNVAGLVSGHPAAKQPTAVAAALLAAVKASR